MIPDQFKQKKYTDAPNPNAKIGLVVFYPFQFYVLKDVYFNLTDDAEFIIDLGVFFPVEQPDNLGEEIIELLKKFNAHYRVIYYEDYYYPIYLKEFFSKYEALVSLWLRGCLTLGCNVNRKKIHLTYGAGKDIITYGVWKRKFDLILAYGSRDYNYFSQYTNCQIVGNPKFDDWFNNQFDKKLLADLQNRLDPSKKTILYLPTHSDLCSIEDLSGQLRVLANDYNLVVKFHYYTVREEINRVKMLQLNNIILYNDDIDLLPLLKLADVVISDNSSAIFDAILADKPLILTEFIKKEYLDTAHQRNKLYRRGRSGPLTYSGSYEQKIKISGLVLTIKDPADLRIIIDKALIDEQFYKDNRKIIRNELFSYQDGKSGQRGAQAIKKFMQTVTMPEKPLLYWTLEASAQSENTRSFEKERRNQNTIQQYEYYIREHIEHGKNNINFFSVVVFFEAGFEKFLPECLKSLFYQNYPVDKYEIIIVNQPPSNVVNEILNCAENRGQCPKIKILKCSTEERVLEKIIEESQGEIICFTRGTFRLPENWLLEFQLAYSKFDEVAGIGGFINKEKRLRNHYDLYYFLKLGEKLGVAGENNFLGRLYGFKNNLFFQNPAGEIANMSYKKTALEDIKDIKINIKPPFIFCENYIKKQILLNQEIYFLPCPAFDLLPFTLKLFLKRNFQEGYAFYNLYSLYPCLKQLRCTVGSLFKLPTLRTFKFKSKIVIIMVFLFGNFFRLLGRYFGFYRKINSSAEFYLARNMKLSKIVRDIKSYKID